MLKNEKKWKIIEETIVRIMKNKENYGRELERNSGNRNRNT